MRSPNLCPLSVGGVLTPWRGWRATNCLWKVFLVIASTKSAGAYVTGPLFYRQWGPMAGMGAAPLPPSGVSPSYLPARRRRPEGIALGHLIPLERWEVSSQAPWGGHRFPPVSPAPGGAGGRKGPPPNRCPLTLSAQAPGEVRAGSQVPSCCLVASVSRLRDTDLNFLSLTPESSLSQHSPVRGPDKA